MNGMRALSNEELMKRLQASGQDSQPSQASDMSSLSDQDLMSRLGQASGAPSPTSGAYKQSLESELQGTLGRGGAFSSGALKGLLGFGRGVGELESKLVDKLLGTKTAGKAPRVELPASMQKQMQQYPTSATAGEFVGGSAPLLAMPEAAAGEIAGLSSSIESLPKALQGLAKFGSKAGKAAAVGAPLGAVYDPDAPLSESMTTGALTAQLGPIVEGASGVTSGIFDALRKMGGTATKDGAEKVMKAADNLGIKVPIAEVIKSKPLQTIQETLGVTPGAGMSKVYTDMSDSLKDQVGGLLTKLNPDNQHSGSAVQEHLIDRYNQAKDISNDIYKNLGESIENMAPGEIHDNKNLSNKASEIGREFYRKEKQPGGKTKIPGDVKDLISQIYRKKYTLKDAIEVDENINSLIGDNVAAIKKGGKEGQDAKRSIGHLRSLKQANQEDIEKTIKSQDIPEITSLWSSAKDHYKKEIVPFVEKGSKLQSILEEKNPDKIQSKFLSTSGTQPKSYELKKVTDDLPQDIKDKITHQYLVGPKYEPEKIIQKFDKLQPQQKKALLSEEDLNTLESMSTLKKHFGGEFNQMFSPKTGYRSMKVGVPAAIYTAGQVAGGQIGGVAALGAAGAGGRGLKEVLMSDALKKHYLKGAGKKSKPLNLGLKGYLATQYTGNNQE